MCMTAQDYEIIEKAVRKARAGGFTFWSEKFELLLDHDLMDICSNTTGETKSCVQLPK